MYTVEHLGDYFLEVGDVGHTKKGIKLVCSQKVAIDLSSDNRFKVTGLKSKTKEKEVQNAG